jgi:hypothetical protein
MLLVHRRVTGGLGQLFRGCCHSVTHKHLAIRTNMTLSSGRCRCDHAVPCRASLQTSGMSPSLTADPHTDTLPVLPLLSMCRSVLTNHTREYRHVTLLATPPTLLVFAWLEQFDLAVHHRHPGPLTPSLTTSPSPYLGLTSRVCLTREFDPACPPLPTLGLTRSLTLYLLLLILATSLASVCVCVCVCVCLCVCVCVCVCVLDSRA